MKIIDNHTYLKRKLEVKMNAVRLEMFFESESKMTFKILDGGGRIENGYEETVKTQYTELRKNLFLVTWKEISGTAVSQIQDFENKSIHSSIMMADGRFYQVKGTIQIMS